MGGMQGIDYTALKTVLEINEIEDKKKAFNEIRLIESGALREIRKNGK